MAGSLKKFRERMYYYCEEVSTGYDQSNRWDIRDNGECDCSSLVIECLEEAGFDVGDASYTGNMSEELCAHGWKRLPFDFLVLQPGDILLNDACHTCAVISGYGRDAIIAQASIDENGRISGGQSGDQTGYETNTRQVYMYSRGWDCILRYSGADSGAAGGGGASAKLDVDGSIGPLTVSEWQRQCGTHVDGVVSGQGYGYRSWYPALSSVTFEGNGSALMQVVQERCGVDNPTGVIARGTVAKLQGQLILWGYDVGTDAIVGVLREGTARALQRSLNDRRWA